MYQDTCPLNRRKEFVLILLPVVLLSMSLSQNTFAKPVHSTPQLTPAALGCWYTKADMPSPRRALSAVELGGVIYVIGGRDGDRYDFMERYNPSTNSWQSLAPMPTPRAWLVTAAVNGRIYAIGGNDGINKLNAVEEYNPVTNSWSVKAPMPTARDDAAIGVVQGKIYVIGGWSTGALTVVEKYDPVNNTWQTMSPLPSPLAMTSGAVVDGKIYVIGGRDNTNDLGHNYMYDPNLDTWEAKVSLPTARSRLASGVSNNKVYVIGGYNTTQGWLGAVERYDPVLDTWDAMNTMPTPRGDIAAATAGGIIYVFGGRSGWESQVLDATEAGDFTCTNDPPNAPANPNPGWGWSNRRLDVNLSWTGSDPNPGDTLTYDVYFGEGLTPQRVSRDQSASFYDPPVFLEPGMTYSWRIAARDHHEAVTSGPRWTFQTSGIPNMITNWSYEYDLTSWNFGVISHAQASITRDLTTASKGAASARIDVIQSQNGLWRVQFAQNDLEFAQDKSYALTFWAKSSTARPISITLRETDMPYTPIYSTIKNISNTWARYQLTFISPANFSQATLEFGLGGHVSSVWIDGARLIESPAVLGVSASPGNIWEPGGVVTFNVDVENISQETATITSLEDLDLGDITNPNNPEIITTDCVDGVSVDPESHYTCEYQFIVEAVPGVLPRMVSASIQAGEAVLSIFGDTSIDVLDIQPEISVDFAASPTMVHAGDMVEFTVEVHNERNEAVSLITLHDSILGSLASVCPLPVSIGSLSNYSCTFDTAINSDHHSTLSATANDDEGNLATADDDTSVDVIHPAIEVVITANVSTAIVGKPVSYLYTISNIGDIPLSGVQLVDDRLGVINLPKTTLAPSEVISTTLTYTPTIGDLPGPLVNNVTATGNPPIQPAVNDHQGISLPLTVQLYLPSTHR